MSRSFLLRGSRGAEAGLSLPPPPATAAAQLIEDRRQGYQEQKLSS